MAAGELPGAEELRRIYGRGYFFGEEYVDYLADAAVLRTNFERRMRVLRRYLDPARHRRLLEIGCAYGLFLDVARRDVPSVRGIDIAEEPVRHARDALGLDASTGDFLDAPDDEVDVVCLWDALEHLAAPHRTVEKIGRVTQSGALLALTTGDIGSWNARRGGKSWRLIHPPTHLHYFTRTSLHRLLERHGFDVVYHRYAGFSRSVDNAAYNVLLLRWRLPWLYAAIKATGLHRARFYLNLYDIMYVIARRRS